MGQWRPNSVPADFSGSAVAPMVGLMVTLILSEDNSLEGTEVEDSLEGTEVEDSLEDPEVEDSLEGTEVEDSLEGLEVDSTGNLVPDNSSFGTSGASRLEGPAGGSRMLRIISSKSVAGISVRTPATMSFRTQIRSRNVPAQAISLLDFAISSCSFSCVSISLCWG